MKHYIIYIFLIFLFSSVVYSQNEVVNKNSKKENKTVSPNSIQGVGDKIEFKNSTGNAVITITDEGGNAGSILIPQSSPSTPKNKLYNINGILNFHGEEVGSELNSFKLNLTTQNGYVLTSDANGNASWQPPSSNNLELNIGDIYQGGIIFWLDGSSEHGLIAAPEDESSSYTWFNYDGSNFLPYGYSRGLFAGEVNTKLLNNFGGSDAPAAKVCYDKSTNGYNDWYLPSLDEVILMMTNLYFENMGNFDASATYWTSNHLETFDSYPEAYYVYLQDGNPLTITVQYGKSITGQTRKVRAVRKF